MIKTIKLSIPKDYNILVMEVGDEEHQPSRELLARMKYLLEEAIIKKKRCIVVPYWIKLKVVEKKKKVKR